MFKIYFFMYFLFNLFKAALQWFMVKVNLP